ncbi:MAG: hypothetical protein DRJ60_02990 [Thermoprotei archaeon]|nr:MAG: hypothetical protein DRJ60_02990 [Thermoprotei archaeon]
MHHANRDLAEKWAKYDEEAREIRKRHANWSFIESQPPRIREALKLYIETGDVRLASKIAGLKLEEFIMLYKKAGIPTI